MSELRKSRSAFDALTWADAWIFASLACATNPSGRILFPQLLHGADILNHAVPTLGEIKHAFRALHRRGLVRVRNGAVFLSPTASGLHHEARAKRAGLFSIVDNTVRVLNSPRRNFAKLECVPDLRFITRSFLQRAWREFQD
jgi:hypothetical protein